MQIGCFIAEVDWVRPRSGKLAPPDKMLGLETCITDGTGYISFKNDDGRERYLFLTHDEAVAFAKSVEERCAKAPQYFVIDDNGEQILDEGGNPIVAWMPVIEVSAAPVGEIAEGYWENVSP